MRDHLDRVARVVEHDERVAEQEHRLRQSEHVFVRRNDAWFVVPHGFVGHVSNRAPRERRQPRHPDRLEFRHLPFERKQRVAVVLAPRSGDENAVWVRSDERVAREPLAALYRFQEERVLTGAHLQERRHRRLEVRRNLAIHRHKVSLAPGGEFPDFVQTRAQH